MNKNYDPEDAITAKMLADYERKGKAKAASKKAPAKSAAKKVTPAKKAPAKKK